MFSKPIIIFNQDGYYNLLVTWLTHCREEHFLRYEGDDSLWTVANTVEEIFNKLTS